MSEFRRRPRGYAVEWGATTPLVNDRIDLVRILLWSLLAGTGGVVRFVSKSVQSDDPYNFNRVAVAAFLMRLFANACISGFSGLMGALLVSTLTTDATWTYIGAGAMGYLGVEGLDYLSRFVRDKFLPRP